MTAYVAYGSAVAGNDETLERARGGAKHRQLGDGRRYVAHPMPDSERIPRIQGDR